MMLLLVGLALYFLMRTLVRSRPGLAIGWPIAVAVGLRVLAAAGVSLTSIASELRGGDELTLPGQRKGGRELRSPLGGVGYVSDRDVA